MASHSSLRQQEPRGSSPNWLELPVDVMASIIKRLGVVQILTSVQHVCSTWRRICRDPSMWRSIDICGGFPPRMYRRTVDLSSGGILDISMKCLASDDLLRYIIDRSSHLRLLRLVYCAGISDHVLIEVAEKMSFLEELDLSYCDFSVEVVAAFGRLSPLLKSFKLNARGCGFSDLESDDEAFAIAKNMSGLHHLQMFGNKLTNVGLLAILNGCQQLESLDLWQCFHISLDADLERRCTQRIKHFFRPNDSTDDYPFNPEVYDEWSDRSPLDFLVQYWYDEHYMLRDGRYRQIDVLSGGSDDGLDNEEMYYEYL